MPPPDAIARRIAQIAFIGGMPRAGTTFLYHNLQKHPDVFVPFRRKTNHFSLHADKPVQWFLDHFANMTDRQVGIDTETLFLIDRNLPSLDRIRSMNPNAKVMLFVRSPGDWAWSLYRQIATFDRAVPDFDQFLRNGYRLVEDGKEIRFNMRGGDIAARIAEMKRLFGANLLLVNFDLIRRDPLRVLQAIEGFLGLAPYFDARNFNPGKINAGDRAHVVWLAKVLRNHSLIAMLGRLPPRFVISVRLLYDRLSLALKPATTSQTQNGASERQAATTFFASDERFVRDLFKDGDVLRGS